ncbi:MAG: hypothetical protein AB7T37_09795 [Dehalococcoidia bacterium]
MDDAEVLPSARPPILLGCSVALTLLLGAIVFASACVVFLESGADSGKVVLEAEGAYPPGSITRVVSSGFYIVNLRGEGLFALSDIDAPNRASASRRCRVEAINPADPAYTEARTQYADRFASSALTAAIVLRENCNGAIFDATGARIDQPGQNLDRLEVTVDDLGRIVVNTARRTCSEGVLANRVEVDCP